MLHEREIDPAIRADIEKFEVQLDRYLSGDLDPEAFRVFRLNNGIYGQRQGGTNQMVRVKVPYGSMTPEQLEMMAYIADRYSRGWGHITTRQNIQFHFVQLNDVPDVMEHLASVGLTSREACGDTVRNIQGCHLAGACPQEVLDITQWAEAAFQHFVRNPLGQRLPRKFKINFSGCATDCGQAMFNDVGVIAATRTLPNGEVERGFRVYIAGGLGANPHPALALEIEVSVIAARTASGDVSAFPVAENTHVDGILDLTVVPAAVAPKLADRAVGLAMAIADALDYVGVLAVEMFVVGDELLVNELAPRPHNSGHWTLDVAQTSQFAQQVRAVCGLGLGDTSMTRPAAAMANLLGDLWSPDEPDWERVLELPNVALHLYGKSAARSGRKMGHLTAWSASSKEAATLALHARALLA